MQNIVQLCKALEIKAAPDYATTTLFFKGKEPMKILQRPGMQHAKAPDVLGELITGVRSLEGTRSYEDWCHKHKRNPRVLRSRADWMRAREYGPKLREFLGEWYPLFERAA